MNCSPEKWLAASSDFGSCENKQLTELSREDLWDHGIHSPPCQKLPMLTNNSPILQGGMISKHSL